MINHKINPFEYIDASTLSYLSREKITSIDKFFLQSIDIKENNLNLLLDKMTSAFKQEINLLSANQINIDILKKTFIDFDKHINGVDESKFQSDINNMNYSMSVGLVVNHGTIQINFISDNYDKNYMAVVLHALNTFCYLFEYDYNGLVIDISLDNNNRINIMPHKQINDYDDLFTNLKKKSAAFSVGGVTYRTNKKLLLTKKEELIKLMFHELIHYIGLDHEFLNIKNHYNMSVNRSNFNLSEAYTELISVILNAGYETLHIIGLNTSLEIDKYKLFNFIICVELNYSLYLTANVLKFYGYDKKTYVDFFDGIGDKKYCPIYIWEYVILRTQLFLNLDKLFNVSESDFRITSKNKNKIADLMKIDNNLINVLAIFMEKYPESQYFSYTLYDFNWNYF